MHHYTVHIVHVTHARLEGWWVVQVVIPIISLNYIIFAVIEIKPLSQIYNLGPTK